MCKTTILSCSWILWLIFRKDLLEIPYFCSTMSWVSAGKMWKAQLLDVGIIRKLFTHVWLGLGDYKTETDDLSTYIRFPYCLAFFRTWWAQSSWTFFFFLLIVTQDSKQRSNSANKAEAAFFSNLASKVTQHHFHHIFSATSKSQTCPDFRRECRTQFFIEEGSRSHCKEST